MPLSYHKHDYQGVLTAAIVKLSNKLNQIEEHRLMLLCKMSLL